MDSTPSSKLIDKEKSFISNLENSNEIERKPSKSLTWEKIIDREIKNIKTRKYTH